MGGMIGGIIGPVKRGAETNRLKLPLDWPPLFLLYASGVFTLAEFYLLPCYRWIYYM
jgi:hypothetical protein